MSELITQLKRALAFESERLEIGSLGYDERRAAIKFAREEHARTAPLIEGLLECVSALEEYYEADMNSDYTPSKSGMYDAYRKLEALVNK